jgi:phenylalanyl-tRNA synthetase beta chain
MKISLAWLKDFVDIPGDTRAFGQNLTGVGLAVDSIETLAGDTVFELDVPTNRPDCLNHLGVAREVSAMLGAALRKPRFEVREAGPKAQDTFSISISDPDLCGRYCGRYIAGVKIKPSPDWLKKRLEAVGIRPINNVADVTNYILMELGQPLHSFDADTLQGRKIIVRRAGSGEKVRTLDGVERELNTSILVIADERRAVAIAGIMGGSETEISPSTTNVLLESAYFDALSIRKSSRSLGLATEASYRFERGADIEMARFACDRAAAMIQELAGGEIRQGAIDIYPAHEMPFVTTLRRARIESFLGAPLDDALVERIFERLEFKVTRQSTGWSVEVPPFRQDVRREEDLLEEIARHHGYQKFPATLPPWTTHGQALLLEGAERLLRNMLAASGYSETIGMAFSDESTERKFRPDIDPVKLLNPMAEDQSILRTSLVPTMLRTIQWNINRGARNLQLYELEKVYSAESERRSLILAGTGALRTKGVHEAERDFNFYDLKGDIEEVFRELGTVPTVLSSDRGDRPSHYHPGRSARYGDVVVFGELHPDYAELFKIRQRVYIAEFDVDAILRSCQKKLAKAIPRFPSIRRDFSLVLDRTTRYADVQATLADANIPELVRVEPFDRLETGPFPESKYSLSISVIYQSIDRTLTDAEVERFDQRILNLLEQRLGAHLRR